MFSAFKPMTMSMLGMHNIATVLIFIDNNQFPKKITRPHGSQFE